MPDAFGLERRLLFVSWADSACAMATLGALSEVVLLRQGATCKVVPGQSEENILASSGRPTFLEYLRFVLRTQRPVMMPHADSI